MEIFASKKRSELVKNFAILLILYFIPQVLIMNGVELSYDEAYYWMYSKFLDWGYYDHPPIVAISIWLGTLIFGDNEFGVRSMFMLYQMGTFYLLMKLIKPKKLVYMVCLFLAMPLLNLNGFVAIPDGPIMFFTTLFFYYIKRYLAEDNWQNSLFLTLAITLMFYSKYHGLLIVLLTTIANPEFLKRKSFWVIVSGVIVLFMPHVYWQYKHNFVSLEFHLFKRVEKHFDILNILNYILSQIVLMGSLLWVLYYKLYPKLEKSKWNRILVFNTVGFLAFIFLMSFNKQIEANWTGSCAIAFMLLFGSEIENTKKQYLYLSFNIILLMMVKVTLIILPSLDSGEKYGRLNELIGWKGKLVPAIYNVCKGKKIVGDSYQITAKLSFYSKYMFPALHLDSRESQYSILNLEKEIRPDEPICYLTSSKKHHDYILDTYYKDPIYIMSNTSLQALAELYGTSYEEIIRN